MIDYKYDWALYKVTFANGTVSTMTGSCLFKNYMPKDSELIKSYEKIND